MEERRGRGVDGTCEQHETLGKDVGGEAEDCVAVNASVLEIDAGSSVGADDDLKLTRSL